MRTSTLTCLIVTFIAFNPSNAKQTQAISDILINIDDHLVVAGVICFIASSISNAGGIGGGGLFIPILTIIAGLDLKTASSFSAFMVTGGSLANVMYNMCTTSPKFGGKSLIDYDMALSSEPCMLLGVSVGVICNIVFPEWFITVMFALFLAWSTTKTCKNGMLLWKVESEEMVRENGVLENVTSEGNSGLEEALLVGHEEKRKLKIPWLKLWVLLLIWLSFISVYILHDNRYGQGIIPMEPCGVGYWFLSSVQVPLALVFTAWVVLRKQSLRDQTLEHEDLSLTRNRESSKLIFPTVALLAGILGGVFGIGGGMLINPLLLQLGIPPEVTAATCSLMVFFSSSMSAFQYMLLGMEHIQIALIFGIMCFVASLVGLLMVKRAIKKYGRVSIIVFSVSIVMSLSTILMTTFGAIKVLRDYKSGTSMGFKLPC